MLRTRTIICGILLAAAVSAASVAQSPSNPMQTGTSLVSMKFPGGSVADYVIALKKAAGNVNIIAAIETGEVSMPAVDLTNASLDSALSVLDGRTAQLPDRHIKLQLRTDGTGKPNEQSVYTVEALVQGRLVDGHIIQRVWSVKAILDEGTKANDLLTAIQTSLDLLNDAVKPAQLKFHEATALIIARANPNQIDAIEQIIGQMTPPMRIISRGAGNERTQALELELQKARMEIDNCHSQLKRLEAELAEAKKR